MVKYYLISIRYIPYLLYNKRNFSFIRKIKAIGRINDLDYKAADVIDDFAARADELVPIDRMARINVYIIIKIFKTCYIHFETFIHFNVINFNGMLVLKIKNQQDKKLLCTFFMLLC